MPTSGDFANAAARRGSLFQIGSRHVSTIFTERSVFAVEAKLNSRKALARQLCASSRRYKLVLQRI
jgi:hypothetical protein